MYQAYKESNLKQKHCKEIQYSAKPLVEIAIPLKYNDA